MIKGCPQAKNMVPSVGEWIWLITEPSSGPDSYTHLTLPTNSLV